MLMYRLRRACLWAGRLGAALLLAVLPAGPETSRAQAAYTYAAPLVRMDPHARSAALGGAFTAVTTDYNLLRYNPAGLGLLSRPLLSASYHSWIETSHQNHFELAFPTRRGGLGMSVSYLNAGSIDEIDASFQTTGRRLHTSDLLWMIGAARQLRLGDGTAAVGVGLRYLYQNLASFPGTALGLDVGSLLAYGPLSMGLAIQNLPLQAARFDRALEPLPRMWRAGVAYYLRRHAPISWLVTADLVRPHPAAPVAWHTGAEARMAGLTLRSGYRIQPGSSGRWQAGLGLTIPLSMFANGAHATVDYTYALPAGGWEPVHYLSVALRPGHRPASTLSVAAVDSDLPPELTTLPPWSGDRPAPRPPRAAPSLARLAPAPTAPLPPFTPRVWPPAAVRPPVLPPDLLALRPPRAAAVQRIPLRPLHEPPALIRVHILFDYGEDTIPPGEYARLDRLAAQLLAMPDEPLWVSGHTDDHGPLAWNLDLSARRIDRVLDALERRYGIPRSRFVKPTAYGETRPIADNRTEAGRALNRRVEFMRLPPGTDPDTFVPEGSLVEGVHALSETTVAVFRNGCSAWEVRVEDGGRRLVLVLPGLFRLDPTPPVPPLERRLIRRLRTEETATPRRTLVVLDLTQPVHYRVEEQGRVLLLHLQPSGTATQ